PNEVPIANAGPDQTLTDTDADEVEEVTLDASASSDPDGEITSYDWNWGESGSATGVDPIVNLPVGTTTITLTVTDDEGATATDQVVITINEPSDPTFTLSPATVEANEDFSGTIEVTINPDDTSADVSYSFNPALDAVTVASLSFDAATKTITIGSLANANGTADIVITATDDVSSKTATQTLSLTISPVNDAPTATNVTASTAENAPVTLTLPATDPDGDALTFSIVDQPGNGTLSAVSDYQVTYTPDANFSGSDSFTFQASDGKGGTSNTATASISVSNINDAPEVANPISNISVSESAPDQVIDISNVFSDPDGDALTLSVSNDNTALVTTTLEDDSTQLRLSFAAGASGTASISLIATDPGSLQATASFDVNVSAVNDAPTASDVTVSTDEDIPVEITLAATDPEGDTLTYEVDTQPGNGTLSTVSGDKVTFTPAPNFFGSASFTYTATDPEGLSSEPATVNITVNSVNDAPVASDSLNNVTVDENAPNTEVNVSGIFTDVEDASLDLSVSNSNSSLLTATLNAGILTLDYLNGQSGTAEITLTATDDQGATASTSFTVTVNPNAPPTANAGPDQTITDADGDTFENVIINASSSSDPDGSIVSYLWSWNDNTSTQQRDTISLALGPHQIVLTVTDDDNAIDRDTLLINIVEPDAPSFTLSSPDFTADEDFSGTPTITIQPDESAPAASYSFSPRRSDITFVNIGFDAASRTLTFTAVPNANGSQTLQITATDNNNADNTFTQTIDVTVNPVNDAPVASDLADGTAEETALLVSLPASDVDKDSLTYSIVQAPANGSLSSLSDAEVTYTPNPDFTGTDTFTFRVADPSGAADTAQVTINVTSENDAPAVSGSEVTTQEDTAVEITLNASDPDGDTLTFSIGTSPDNGSLSEIVNGKLTYTPALNFSGTDSFTFSASDGTFSDGPATVTITVSPVNDQPQAESIPDVEVNEDAANVSLNLDNFFSDVEDNSLVYTVSNNTQPALLTTSVTGSTLTLDFVENANGNAQLTLRATDSEGAFAETSLEVIVNSVNDAPEILGVTEPIIIDEDQAFTLSLGDLNVTDPDHIRDQLSLSVLAGNNYTAEGTTITPASNFFGTLNVPVRVTDPAGASDDFTLQIQVNPVNDVPQVVGNIEDTTLVEDADPVTIDLTSIFSDVEDSSLAYAVSSNSNPGLVTPSIASGQLTLSLQANQSGSANIRISATDDQGASVEESFRLTVTAVNDAPVITSTVTQTMQEDSRLKVPFSAFDVTDPDDTYPDDFTIILRDNSETNNYTLEENNTVVVPAPNYFGDLQVNAVVNDGQVNSNTVTLTINVTNVNDAPVLAGIEKDPIRYSRNDPPVAITNSMTIEDIDNANLTSASVIFNTSNSSFFYSADEDELLFTSQAGITGSWQPAEARLLLSGNASVRDYEAAIRSIRYVNNSATPTPISRRISIRVNDGNLNSNEQIRIIGIDDSNVPPQLSDINVGSFVEDGSVTLNAQLFADNYSDDLDPFNNVIFIVTLPSHGVLSVDGTTITDSDLSLEEGGYRLDFNEVNEIEYRPAPNYNGNDSFLWTAQDQQGAVGVDAAVNFTILSVPDAPRITAPSTITTNEDVVFTFVDTRKITVEDPDADTGELIISLSVSEGLLTFINESILEELTFIEGDGKEDSKLSFRGTMSDINSALTSLQYRSAANFNGNDILQLTVSDQVTDEVRQNIPIEIRPVNDPPRISGVETEVLVYQENQEPVTISETLVIQDIDNDNLTAATVTIDQNYVQGHDMLSFTPSGGISGRQQGNRLILTGNASLQAYQDVLRTVAYANSSDVPSTARRRISFQVTDTGNGTSNSSGRLLDVIPADDSLLLSSQQTEPMFFQAGGQPLLIAETLDILDPDDSTLTSALILIDSITYLSQEDSLLLPEIDFAEVSWNDAEGSLLISGEASIAAYLQVLQQLAYLNTSTEPSLGERIVSITVFRSGMASNTLDLSISLAVNEPPVISDFSFEILKNEELSFGLDQFSSNFSDPEAASESKEPSILIITQLPQHGSLYAGTQQLTEAQFNRQQAIELDPDTLQTFVYIPDQDYVGEDSFSWNASDGQLFANEDARVTIAITELNVDAGEDVLICEDETALLSTSVSGGSEHTYLWSCDQPECALDQPEAAEVTASPSVTTTYYVMVTDRNGVSNSDTVVVEVEQCRNLPLSIPNGITPNGDGINDTWQISNIDTYEQSFVEVYDRSGKQVFYSEGYAQPWDGTYNGQVLPAGTYYFLIRLNPGLETYRGSVSILK
ncbi:MAG: tandem-95 repeat protein, partial [Cyclobacteriaceae bacterium]